MTWNPTDWFLSQLCIPGEKKIPCGHNIKLFLYIDVFDLLIRNVKKCCLFIKDIGLYFLKYCLCLVLVSGWHWLHRMGWEVFPPLVGRFYRSDISSLNVWYFSPMKTSGPGVLRGLLKLWIQFP